MPRVKAVWINSRDFGSEYDSAMLHCIVEDTPWTNVTEEELEELRRYAASIPRVRGDYTTRAYIVEEIPSGRGIKELLMAVAEKRDATLREQLRREKAIEAAKRKRAAGAEERKRKKYEQLKKEFEKG